MAGKQDMKGRKRGRVAPTCNRNGLMRRSSRERKKGEKEVELNEL